MVHAPIFLDSSSLNDLRELISDGLHNSDVFVLILTDGVLTRPWCLLEVFEAKTRGVPIVLLDVIGGGFDVGRMQAYISDLETKMGATNPTGLELLKQELQATPLSQLQEAVLDVLESFDAGAVLSWNPGAGDRAMLAALKDLVERMALLTKRKVHWRGEKNKTRNSARWNSKVLSCMTRTARGTRSCHPTA